MGIKENIKKLTEIIEKVKNNPENISPISEDKKIKSPFFNVDTIKTQIKNLKKE